MQARHSWSKGSQRTGPCIGFAVRLSPRPVGTACSTRVPATVQERRWPSRSRMTGIPSRSNNNSGTAGEQLTVPGSRESVTEEMKTEPVHGERADRSIQVSIARSGLRRLETLQVPPDGEYAEHDGSGSQNKDRLCAFEAHQHVTPQPILTQYLMELIVPRSAALPARDRPVPRGDVSRARSRNPQARIRTGRVASFLPYRPDVHFDRPP